MGFKYEELSRFSIEHEFYANNALRGVKISPLASTNNFLKNQRILFRQENSTAILLQEGKRTGDKWEPTIPFNGFAVLYFGLNFNDKNFQVKTDLPYYVTSNSKLFFRFGSDEEFTPKVIPFVTGILDSVLFGLKNHDIKDCDGNKLVPIQQNSNQKMYFSERLQAIDLSSIDATYDNFVWAPANNNFDAIIELRLNNNLGQKHSSRLKSRSINWLYTLVSKFKSNLTDCVIIEDSNKITFEKISIEPSSGHSEFITKNPVKLKESYTEMFYIELDGDCLKSSLPYPSLSNLTNDPRNKNQYVLKEIINI